VIVDPADDGCEIAGRLLAGMATRVPVVLSMSSKEIG
jgi:hypothetical protein